jgi:hypothetical protein
MYGVYANMPFITIFCNEKVIATARVYHGQYPGHRVPCQNTFNNVHRILKDNGSFPLLNIECKQTQLDKENALDAVQ